MFLDFQYFFLKKFGPAMLSLFPGYSFLLCGTVHKYCAFLRDFPLQSILSASEPEEFVRAVVEIYAHMRTIKRIEYPLPRAIELLHGMTQSII